MEADAVNRYRSRILREMNANRNNPFNSPPSSTGSHGTVSPTMSSVFSDPDGESTRRLNEDIARVTAPRKVPVNWEAAHRKWPEYYSKPKDRHVSMFDDDNTDTRPMSSESKENRPPVPAVKFNDDNTTQDTWHGSTRTRAEMQPRVDNESDLSSILSKSPARGLSVNGLSKHERNPSPLSKVHTRKQSGSESRENWRSSLTDALERLRRSSKSPKSDERQHGSARERSSPQMSSAKSSLTAVPSPTSMESPSHNASHVRSFFMPDVSHLGDFVTGTLRFSGSMRNGVPVFVKNGKVHDRHEGPEQNHADVDGFEVPEDEEKIFVSMDMIREEIVSLQESYDKVQEYASTLQQQVESLEHQLRSKSSSNGRSHGSNRVNEHVLEQKNRLEVEVATLQSRLEQASRKISINEIENDSLTQEKDRAVRKLQEACDDINKLTRKLSVRERELETSHKQLESTEQMRHDNDTLRRDIISLKHGRDALELENTSLRSENETLQQQNKELQEESDSLRSDNDTLRRQHQSLITENRSLRTNNKTLMDENEDLRQNVDGLQQELEDAYAQIEALRNDAEKVKEEKSTLQEDNKNLVRHNENYFNENKVLRRENSGFERSIHDLHDENLKMKEEIDSLKQQLDHCRPIPKEDFSAQLDEETEENMTSAFFIPDITMNSNETGPAENTGTRDMPVLPELTSQSNKLPTLTDVMDEGTQKSTKDNRISEIKKQAGHRRTKSTGKVSSKNGASANPKVAFSIPGEASLRSSKSTSNLANQGSKRRNTSQASQQQSALKKSTFINLDMTDNEDTTGFLSGDNTTQDQSVPIQDTLKSRKEAKGSSQSQLQFEDLTSHSQRSHGMRPQSRLHRRLVSADMTSETQKTSDTCPALSTDARRVLDGLCEHNCRNCIVCSRITSHRGVISSAEAACGKKRVTVSRPVPVTDRNLSVEDPTMRPSQSPGHALALVIKGLEDESRHLQLDLSRLQAQYNSSDKALGRRERLSMAESIRTMLKRLEAKNDQIYSLYDVLEGQKAAGQAMTEEEIEMTVLNITGMTVRDVTSGSEQLTWEGVSDL